jgi:hypothetical protein
MPAQFKYLKRIQYVLAVQDKYVYKEEGYFIFIHNSHIACAMFSHEKTNIILRNTSDPWPNWEGYIIIRSENISCTLHYTAPL